MSIDAHPMKDVVAGEGATEVSVPHGEGAQGAAIGREIREEILRSWQIGQGEPEDLLFDMEVAISWNILVVLGNGVYWKIDPPL